MIDAVLKIIAKSYSITVSDILGKSKKEPKPEAKKMACYFLKKLRVPQKEIAYSVNKNRTHVYKSTKQISFEIKHYKEVKQTKDTIEMALLKYLETTKDQLESWLKNNPHQDQAARDKKLERLAEVNETYEYIINN